jgi:ATP-dependent exoDNAse (exonuclease V) alpha subunit
LAELDGSGGFGRSAVLLFDEAGTAPTRPSARLFARAEQSGAKVIAVGDSGQLASVAAGGWFAAISEKMGGPELRQVMRQRDPAEREALEALHDGDPEPYLGLKQERSELAVHELEDDALEAILADWNQAKTKHGVADAVMIARDNVTRTMLNDRAREQLIKEGMLSTDGVDIADQEFRIGDRVIARRNDRYRDVDNGTLATITEVDRRTGALTVSTDSGAERVLDAAYAAEHLEHAYALTGHGPHGATVEWAGVIGRPSEFTREWAYTSLSRARGRTRVYVVADATAAQRRREEYAPPEPERTKAEVLDVLSRAMRRREAERLATETIEAERLPEAPQTSRVPPLAELAEAGSDDAAGQLRSPSQAGRRTPDHPGLGREHGSAREI